VLPAHSGRELRFVLTAVRDAVPQVAVEVVMTRGGYPLEVAQLDLAEARAAGEVLRALAVELAEPAQERAEQE
jgi:hypothetical protein